AQNIKYDVAHVSFLIEFEPVGTSLTRFGIPRMSPRCRFGIVCIARRLPHVRSNSARRLPHATWKFLPTWTGSLDWFLAHLRRLAEDSAAGGSINPRSNAKRGPARG